jgi:1-acyl-sn-glycerol-3-phosphate acyltransferase
MPDQSALPLAPTGARHGGADYKSIDYSGWSPLQKQAQRLLSAMFRLLADVEVSGLENIPRSGPAILAVNHLSMIDVPLILTILPRRVICLAADRLQSLPFVRWFLDLGHTIYVRRGEADEIALRQGLAVLRAGGLLGVAPEGTRSRSAGLNRGHSGIAYLASEAPAPILPVAAYGHEQIPRNFRRLRRSRVQVRVGTLIHITPGQRTAAKLQDDTERVMTAIAAMLPQAYRGVYGDGIEQSESLAANVGAIRSSR